MAGSVFDIMQSTAFQTVQNLYGYDASWTPANGGATYSAKVLFQNPTEIYKLGGLVSFDPYRYEMEWKYNDFPGLKEAVDDRNMTPEKVTIDGNEYHILAVDVLYDGKTFRATLQKIFDQ